MFGMLLGGLGISGLGVLASQPVSGQVSIDDFAIQDFNREITEPVSKAELTVSGEYNIQSDIIPGRLVFRLEAKQGLEFTQIATDTRSDDLSTDTGGSYELIGNLLESDIEAIDLSPNQVGESKTVEVDVRVKLTVQGQGRELKEYVSKDTFLITVDKTTGETTIQMSGTGSLEMA